MLAISILFVTAIALLFLGIFQQRTVLQPIALVGLILAFLAICPFCNDLFGENAIFGKYAGQLVFDQFARGFSAIAIAATFMVVGLSVMSFKNLLATLGDHLGLIIMSLCGALCMVSFTNLTMLFIGIEILSIPLYVLAGSRRDDLRSNEAALKYFLMGSFATGIFLFGVALIYGATGSFEVHEIATRLQAKTDTRLFSLVGMALIAVGMAFKISAAPFHFWAPDVYEGTPNLVTAYMSTVVKIAGLAAIYRLFSTAFVHVIDSWAAVFAVLSALSMCIGNFTAIFQTNFKRMMAYSGISHAGYLLMAVVSADIEGSAGALLLYLGSYSIATLIAFGVFVAVSEAQDDDQSLDSFDGLGSTRPWLAAAMTIAILTLAGIPPLAGFFGKYFLFTATFQKYPWLVGVAIMNSAVSIYYYFKLIIAMYFKQDSATRQYASFTAPSLGLVLAGAVVLILALTIAPSILYSLLN
jgi:NADH-quinone oxidoreductase subunit N